MEIVPFNLPELSETFLLTKMSHPTISGSERWLGQQETCSYNNYIRPEWAIHHSQDYSGENTYLNLKLVDVWLKDASTNPASKGVRATAHVKFPGWGRTLKRRPPGAVAVMPMRPLMMADAGAEAHGWDQLRFGFSGLVQASITAVAPALIMEHQEFVSQVVMISSAKAPWSPVEWYKPCKNP